MCFQMILMSLLIFYSLSQEIKEIQPGKRVQGFQAKWLNQNGDFYRFILEEKKENSDLVIMVKAINPGGDPNIFISKVNIFPSTQKDSEVASCAASGNDLCIIDKSNIEINQSYYIGVICNGNCRYELRIDYDEEYTLEKNDFVQFKLSSEQQSEIIKVQLDEYSKSDVELEIEVRIVNYHELENEFTVYLNKGNKIPSSAHFDVLALDTWSGAKLISLSIQEYPYKSIFTLLITSQSGSIVQVRTKTYGIQKDLSIFEAYHGVVEQNQKKVFKLKIDNLNYHNQPEDPDKIKMFIKLTPFLGHATLYVHLDYEPVLLTQYKYQYEQQSSQILMISQKDFQVQQWSQSKEIYIAVYGNELCTFELQTGFQDFEYQFIEINVPYEGKLYNDEIINYWFAISGNQSRKVSVSLIKYQGETNIYLKRCDADSQCKIIQDDIESSDWKLSHNLDDLFIFKKEMGNQMLIFDYEPQFCSSFGDYYNCVYVFAIVPVFTSTRQNDEYSYQVQVSMQSNHINLRENTPQKSIVERLQYNYFKFIVDDKQDIQRIAFILTPIQGQFRMFASTEIKRPNSTSFEKQSSHNVIRYGNEENEQIKKGTYCLSVYGETAGLYTITVVVIRENEDIRIKGKYAWQYIQLYEGSPQDYVLEYGEIGLYKIDLAIYLNNDQDILKFHDNLIVEILQESGQVIMYGFDHPTSNISESRWNSTNQILISSMEKDYPEVLYLRVEPEKSNTYVQFRIVYRLGWKTTTLILNENYFGYIQKDDYQYFQYTFYKMEDVVLTKKAQSDNDQAVEIIVITNSNRYVLKSGSMVISASELPLNECKTKQSQMYFCSIQIEVKSEIDTFFSLLISRDNSQIQLTESQPLFQIIPETYHHYYIICQSINDVIINVVNLGFPQQLQIMVALYKAEDYKEKGKYLYITNLNKLKPFKVSKTHIGVSHSQVNILAREFSENGCYQNCILAITIQKIQDLDYYLQSNQQYMIQYSSGSVFLLERMLMYGAVDKYQIKYFEAVVYNNDTNLMILLTPSNNCDVNLYVSKDQYPNQDKFDWSSQEYMGDQLVIESGNPIYPEMEGNYYIGVVADTYCPFTLVYQTGKFHFYKIEMGIPYNLILKKDELAYFKYTHYGKDDFTILIHSNNQGIVYYVEQLQSLDIDLKEFDRTSFSSFSYNNNNKGYNSNLRISATESNNTNYLIAVDANKDVDFVIAVQVRFQRIYLASDDFLMNGLEQSQSQNYSYYSQNRAYLKIFLLEGKLIVNYGSEGSNKLEEKLIFSTGNIVETAELQIHPDINHNGIFIIQVTALAKATFKIACGNAQSKRVVNIGENYEVSLKPQAFETFIYKSIKSNEKQTFSILVTVLLNVYSQMSYSKLKEHMPTVSVEYSNTKGSKQSLNPIYDIQIEHNFYLEFEAQEGSFEIEIFNTYSNFQQFNVIFGSNYLNVLTPNLKRISVLDRFRYKYWEFFCPTTGKIFLQAQSCGSTIILYTSHDIETLRNGSYEELYQINEHLIEELPIKHPGHYYLSSLLVQGMSSQEQAPFTITAQLVSSDSYIPSKDIKPGQDGYLQWQLITKDDKYYLQVRGAQLEVTNVNNPDFTISTILYYLIFEYAQTQSNTYFNYCLDTQKFVQKVYYSKGEFEKPFELIQELDQDQLVEAEIIQFNVFADAIVQLKNNEYIHLESYYQLKSISNDLLDTLRWKRIMKYSFLLVLLILLLTFVIRYVQKKYKSKHMQFEITEQPNIEMHYTGLKD